MSLIQAVVFADDAHRGIGQVRKYTNEPYIIHASEVAALVKSVPHTREMLIASWLHDVVEDPKVPIEEIRERFGDIVAAHVADITDISRPQDGNRAARKAMDLAHLAKASPGSQTIKLADIISNTQSIVERDPVFAAIYLPEKAAQLEVLKLGDTVLWGMAKDLVESGLEELARQQSLTGENDGAACELLPDSIRS